MSEVVSVRSEHGPRAPALTEVASSLARYGTSTSISEMLFSGLLSLIVGGEVSCGGLLSAIRRRVRARRHVGDFDPLVRT